MNTSMRLMTVNDIAEALSVGRDTAQALMRQMRHINVSTGNRRELLRVYEHDFRAWLESRAESPETQRGKGTQRKPRTITELDLELFEPDGRVKRRRHA